MLQEAANKMLIHYPKKEKKKKIEKKSTQVETCGFVVTGTVGKSGMMKAMITGWCVIPVCDCSAQELSTKHPIIGTWIWRVWYLNVRVV